MSAIEDHAVELIGTGSQTVVFAHGYGCDQSMWHRLISHLDSDARFILFDLMGCGASNTEKYDRTRYQTLSAHADDLVNLVREMDLKNVVLVGHSVSALTVTMAANELGDIVDRVVLVCPTPSFINDKGYVGGFDRTDVEGLLDTLDANYLGWSSQMAPAIMGAPHDPDLGTELTNSFCRTDPDIARHFAHVTFLADHREDVKKLTQPALIIQCKEDVLVPRSVWEWMEQNMQNATVTVLDAVGHCPHVSYPQDCASVMNEFMSVRHSP